MKEGDGEGEGAEGDDQTPEAGVRLQRYMAQAGVASRRKGETLITGGHVKVNGKVVTELGTRVRPGHDRVDVDGVRVQPQEKAYLVLNKPKGCVTTVSDPEGRATVMDLLPRNLPSHVVPVGRLDFYTEGVLLFTNDGDLAAALLHPRGHVEKTYHVKIRGQVTDEQLERLRSGVRLDDDRWTLPAQVDTLKFTGTHQWLVITIREGQSRQVHRMCDSVRLQVIKLARVSFGGITYFGLKVGESRFLTPEEVLDLQKLGENEQEQHKLAAAAPRPRRSAPRPAFGAGAPKRPGGFGGAPRPVRPGGASRPVPGGASRPVPGRASRPVPAGGAGASRPVPAGGAGASRPERSAAPARRGFGGARPERLGASPRPRFTGPRAERPAVPSRPAYGGAPRSAPGGASRSARGGASRPARGGAPRSTTGRGARPARSGAPWPARSGAPRPARSGAPRPARGGVPRPAARGAATRPPRRGPPRSAPTGSPRPARGVAPRSRTRPGGRRPPTTED